ncbi:MAG TPA: HMG-box domain-containing protein [Anaerolineales bacterium]|nr:HMG-box domain-containing protein [Anaerolineales bacterium]
MSIIGQPETGSLSERRAELREKWKNMTPEQRQQFKEKWRRDNGTDDAAVTIQM